MAPAAAPEQQPRPGALANFSQLGAQACSGIPSPSPRDASRSMPNSELVAFHSAADLSITARPTTPICSLVPLRRSFSCTQHPQPLRSRDVCRLKERSGHGGREIRCESYQARGLAGPSQSLTSLRTRSILQSAAADAGPTGSGELVQEIVGQAKSALVDRVEGRAGRVSSAPDA